MIIVKGFDLADWRYIQDYIRDVLSGVERPDLPLEEFMDDADTQIY